MSALDHSAQRRIKGSLALLDSPSDGERLAALEAIRRILTKHGLAFTDLTVPVLPAIMPRMQTGQGSGHGYGMRPANVEAPHQRRARVMLHSPCGFSDFERDVLETLAARRRMSVKQEAIFRECVGKYAKFSANREASI